MNFCGIHDGATMPYHPGPLGPSGSESGFEFLPTPFDLCSLPSVDSDSDVDSDVDSDENKDSDPCGTWLSELVDETIRQSFGPIPFIATAPKQYFGSGPSGDTDSVFLPRAEDLIRSVARSTPPSVVNLEVELNPLSSMLTCVSEVDHARAASWIDSLPWDYETLYPSPMIRERFEPPPDDAALAPARATSVVGRQCISRVRRMFAHDGISDSSIVSSPQGVYVQYVTRIDVPQSIDVAHELWKRARLAERLRLVEKYISSYVGPAVGHLRLRNNSQPRTLRW